MSIPQQVADILGDAGVRGAADTPHSQGGYLVEDDGEGGAIVRWSGPGPDRLADCQAILQRAGFRVDQVSLGAESQLRVTIAG